MKNTHEINNRPSAIHSSLHRRRQRCPDIKQNIMATKFFFCKHCGNVVVKVVDSGVIPVCCGEQMVELTPNTIDGMGEKHLPVLEWKDGHTLCVKVGSQPHPMLEEHHIQLIVVESDNGLQLRRLKPDGEAKAEFCACKKAVSAVYELCNIHGLWKTLCTNNECETSK